MEIGENYIDFLPLPNYVELFLPIGSTHSSLLISTYIPLLSLEIPTGSLSGYSYSFNQAIVIICASFFRTAYFSRAYPDTACLKNHKPYLPRKTRGKLFLGVRVSGYRWT